MNKLSSGDILVPIVSTTSSGVIWKDARYLIVGKIVSSGSSQSYILHNERNNILQESTIFIDSLVSNNKFKILNNDVDRAKILLL